MFTARAGGFCSLSMSKTFSKLAQIRVAEAQVAAVWQLAIGGMVI